MSCLAVLKMKEKTEEKNLFSCVLNAQMRHALSIVAYHSFHRQIKKETKKFEITPTVG